MGILDKLFGKKPDESSAANGGLNSQNVKFKTRCAIPAPSMERISKLESYYQVKFPVGYLEFLKTRNGGIPEPNSFNLNGHERVIERFLPVCENPKTCDAGCYDVNVVHSQILERLTSDEDSTGAEMFPIAALFAGDCICLDYRTEKDNPAVCIWSHEESEDFAPVTYPVAKDFDAFLKMLSE